jgi:hypothetical protein
VYVGGKKMKNLEEKDRKDLEAKMATAFQEKIGELPTELREILIDDMVTAFENRLNVLNRAAQETQNQPQTMDSNVD